MRGDRLVAPLLTDLTSLTKTSIMLVEEGGIMDCLRVALSIIIPPVGVFLKVGLGGHFWLNILLTLLGYIPGLVHAIWIIARED